MPKSKIEWTGATWNPIRARNKQTGRVGTHCVKISPGCANCYAEAHNARLLPHGSSGLPYTGAGAADAEYFIDPKMLSEPLRRKKSEVYFVCSLTDLFMYPPEMVARLYAIMVATPWHTYQVLTKRPNAALVFMAPGMEGYEDDCHNLAQHLAGVTWDGRGSDPCLYLSRLATKDLSKRMAWRWPPPNVLFGVSVEDRKHGLPRIEILRQIPAALRFLSIEPLLEDLGTIDLTGISWVIVGGESGHGARPCDLDWIRSVGRQCKAAEVPLFVKQAGAFVVGQPGDWVGHRLIGPVPTGRGLQERMRIVLRDRKGGDMSEWPEDLRVRRMPEVVR